MSPASAGYHFLPWVRFGVLSGAAKPDTFDATLQPRLTIPVKLRVNDVAADDVSVPLTVYGPGDVVGIDPREVVRTEPRHLTPDFPPNLFASVEFDRPDFPWLFTPASPGTNRLRPWIALVVVRKAVATMTTDPRRPLPRLTCPVSELPDLREAWLWAHGVYAGALDGRTVNEQLAARPDQAISRLLCPRRLAPSQGGPDAGYLACVVPVFELGRKAGLAEAPSPADASSLRLAWDTTTPGVVQLPVYYQWEFSTGPEGDFEDAVDRLHVVREVPDTPPSMMDASRPDPAVGVFPGVVLPVGSALRPAGQRGAAPPAGFEGLRLALRNVLETPVGTGPRVAAPIYGRWQANGAGVHGPSPLAPGAAPGWFSELNLDPRRRVAAALGAQVVQHQQEQLVASAWEQAGEAQAVNQWLRQKQLGREVTRSVFDKRLVALSPAALQQITAPVALAATVPPQLATATVGTPKATRAAPNALAEAVVSPVFRRIARPLGPASRPPAGSATPRSLTSNATRAAMTTVAGSMSALLTDVIAGTFDDIGIVPTVETVPLAQAVAGAPTIPAAVTPIPPAAPLPPPPGTPTVRSPLDPDATFALEAQARLQLPAEMTAGRTDPLAPLMLTPSFPQPMYEPLRDLFPQMLLPGIERIPDNSIMLLEVDPAFVEAYMAGLNDEMSRELLWREYPTDLRGTYFRQFWDVQGQLSAAPDEAERERLRDIPPIAQWQAASLGGNMAASKSQGVLLLLLKGDLLRRFPTALAYAARAKWAKNSLGGDVQVVDAAQPPAMPQMRIDPVPGVTLLGFSLVGPGGVAVTADTVAGGRGPQNDPGWFFVLEEHPTEPRFGLDMTAGPLTTWRELAWPHVATRSDGSGYIAVGAQSPTLVAPPSTAPQEERDRFTRELAIKWGGDAAAMAYITLQKPFRQEVHAGYWFRSNAQFVRQTVPAVMVSGKSYAVSITVRNVGTTTWTPGGANAFRLGSQNPQDNAQWGTHRRDLTAPVAPGAEVTFAFSVIAPAPGTYMFQWRMVQELVEWFGPLTPNVAVVVNPVATSSVYGRNMTAGIGGMQL